MGGTSVDGVIFGAVVAARILVPLAIPRFPLPAMIAALVIDWLICTWAIAQLLLRTNPAEQPWVPALVFAVQYLVLVGIMGQTFGHRLAGIRVAAMDGGDPRWLPVLVRTVLLVLALPAVLFDRDNRGMHDRISNTMVVRM